MGARFSSQEQILSDSDSVSQEPESQLEPATLPDTNPDPSWLMARGRSTRVLTWMLPDEMSQSQFGGREEESNACCVIALSSVKAASLPGNFPTTLPGRIPLSFLAIYTNAVLEGYSKYPSAIENKRRKNPRLLTPYLTISEAICTMGGAEEIDHLFCQGPMVAIMIPLINGIIDSFLIKQLSFFGIIVVAAKRSISICFDRNSDTLLAIDTHKTDEHGPLIAASRRDDISEFAFFTSQRIFADCDEDNFEISVINSLENGCCGSRGSIGQRFVIDRRFAARV